MAQLAGTISMTGLPPQRGLIINLCFFPIDDIGSPVPFDGDPPPEAITDCEKLYESVNLDNESRHESFEHSFVIERPAGYYYVQLRVIMFRTRSFAQTEQFFFARRPVHISSEPEGHFTLPISWPTEPLEALHHYGGFAPTNKRPWWRFW
jgi:hypothetical protein